MRFGLFALSIAMLTTGGLAAQSAFAISLSATPGLAPSGQHEVLAKRGATYGSLPFTAARAQHRIRGY